jgi:hypothetical protein
VAAIVLTIELGMRLQRRPQGRLVVDLEDHLPERERIAFRGDDARRRWRRDVVHPEVMEHHSDPLEECTGFVRPQLPLEPGMVTAERGQQGGLGMLGVEIRGSV